MFDPSKLISPFQSTVNAIDAKDPIYKLLIDKYNAKVQSVNHQNKRTNSLAVIEQIDPKTKIPFTRQIEYDRLDIGEWMTVNTTTYVDKFGISRRSLISGNVNESSINVDIPTLATVLYDTHNIFISESDLTYGANRRFEPVNTDYGTAYILLNCTTYGDVVSYTSGNTVVNHLNIGRSIPIKDDNNILPGFSITRNQIDNETLQIKLPILDAIDDWSIMIESINNLTDKLAGVFWLKIELTEGATAWNVVDSKGNVATLDANVVNPITIRRVDDVITLTGTSTFGESETFIFETDAVTSEYVLQRITAYSRNPYATTLQFEMSSDSEPLPETDEEPVVAAISPDANVTLDLVKDNTISAHPKSNALVGRIDMPVTLTDLISVNYKEYAKDTYKTASNVKYKHGIIDRVSSITEDKMIKGVVKVAGLPELIRSGKFNKITFNGYSKSNNGYDHGVWSFEVLSVNLEANTMSVVIRHRNEPAVTITDLDIPSDDEFKYEVCSGYMRFDLDMRQWWVPDYYGSHGVGDGRLIKQQNVAVGLYLNVETVLPTVTYTKEIEDYQIG